MSFLKRGRDKGKGAVSGTGLTVSQQVQKDGGWSSDFILSAIQDGVVMVGRDNIIHLFNPGASAITGWPATEAVGLDFHSVLTIVDEHGVAYPPGVHPFAKALTSGQAVRDSKGWLITRGNKKLPVSIIVSPLTDASGKPTETVVGILRDITSEKTEERQRSDFISTASHEMRTPLAAIEGYLSLALNPKIAQMDENSRKYVEKAVVATRHMSTLFQDLLNSSRAEDGRLASYPQVVEMGELVEQVTDAARFNAKKKNLNLQYIVSNAQENSGDKVVRPLYYAYVDPNRVREVIQNIIDNALKYTMEGGVAVKLTGDNTVIQIQVQDSGPGIPAEDIPHLFQKFYRVDNSMTRTVGGTGLGLFISRLIIEMYQGRIWVESTLDKGSVFFINLPRLNAQQALERQKSQSAMASPLDPNR